MKTISWTDLKKKLLVEIKEGSCLKVTGDGETAFYVIVRPEGLMMNKIEGLCSQIDASRGKDK